MAQSVVAGVFRKYRPVRTHVIGVGTAKSGTHSLASLFQPAYRAAHEHDAANMIGYLAAIKGGAHDREFRSYLIQRQRHYRWEVDSSQLNGHAVATLVDLFPNARFVLTVRHPRAYLDSITRHTANRGVSSPWQLWRDVRFAGHEPRPQDQPLIDRGMYPVDGYLTDWVTHNNRVLEAVPPDRLLVVETLRIADEIDRIAGFAEVPVRRLNDKRAHTFSGVGDRVELDSDYIDERVDALCAATLARLDATKP